MTSDTGRTPARPEVNLAYMSMRAVPIVDRVRAAAGAGFDGIGLRPEAMADIRAQGWDDRRVRDLVADHGLRISEIEPIRIFRDDLLDLAVAMAGFFEVPRVQVAPPFEPDLDLGAAAVWMREAARRLAPATLAIEFIPTTGVADLATADRLIEMIDHPNVGSCVDVWHVFRGGGLDSISDLNQASVVVVQLNDGTILPTLEDYIEDCLAHRRPVGDGEFPIDEFLARMPPSAPISVEVISTELDALPPAEVARRLYDTTAAALDRRRPTSTPGA